MCLVSNKVDSMHAHPSSPKFELLKMLGLEDGKSVKDLPNCAEGLSTTLNVRVFTLFFIFMLYRMLAKSILPPKMTHYL